MGESFQQPSVSYEKGELMYILDDKTNEMKEVTVETKSGLQTLKLNVGGVARLVGMTDEMTREQGGKVNVENLVSSGKELTDEQVQSMSIEELNAYEKAKWKAEARENGVEFTGKKDKDGFDAVKDFDGVGLGTKEYKGLKDLGLQGQHNALRDFLRQNNQSDVKILQVEKLSAEEQKNGLDNAIKAVVAKGAEQETILFGKDKNGKFKILSLSNQTVKGSKKYVNDFLTTKAHKSDTERKDWQVNQDIIFDKNGKATSANIEEGEGEMYIDKSGQIVKGVGVIKKGETVLNSKDLQVKNSVPNNDLEIPENLKIDSQVKHSVLNNNVETHEKSYIERQAEKLNEKTGSDNYFTNYEDGMREAKERSQDVIVVAVSETCTFCNQLLNETFASDEFRSIDDNKIIILQDSENIDNSITGELGEPTSIPQSYILQEGVAYKPKVLSNGFRTVEEYKKGLEKNNLEK